MRYLDIQIMRHTGISIQSNAFYINGQPTYHGRYWQSCKIEGLLLNARLVQGIFDDLNPETSSLWAYPDTGVWNPERNTREFISSMTEWQAHGLLAFTINLQGGNPQGYSQSQHWHNSAITEAGELRLDYMKRLEHIIDRADELGMVVILGIFYFGQAYRLKNEDTIYRAINNTVDWIFDHRYQNILIEINNECNIIYNFELLKPPRVVELIEHVKCRSLDGNRLLVSTSFSGGTIPDPRIAEASDFILLHGNGVHDPTGITDMICQVRQVSGNSIKPILFNEDDHFDFGKHRNNFLAAIHEYTSWGYFDYRLPGEGYDEGYQSVPVNWQISSGRKRGFFNLLKKITTE